MPKSDKDSIAKKPAAAGDLEEEAIKKEKEDVPETSDQEKQEKEEKPPKSLDEKVEEFQKEVESRIAAGKCDGDDMAHIMKESFSAGEMSALWGRLQTCMKKAAPSTQQAWSDIKTQGQKHGKNTAKNRILALNLFHGHEWESHAAEAFRT